MFKLLFQREEKVVRSKVLIGALAVAAVATIYLYEALKLPMGSLKMPGMGFMPVISGASLLLLCLILAVGELLSNPYGRGSQNGSGVKQEAPGDGGSKTMIIFIPTLLIYPAALTYLGFIMATTALLYIALRIMNYRNGMASLLAALVATVAAELLFSNLLGVSLPLGKVLERIL